MESEHLQIDELRRRLVANAFPTFDALGPAIAELGFVQADPIRSPARAQDLILRHRVTGYRAGDLEERYPEIAVEEGVLFAYGFSNPEVWKALRWRGSRRLTKKERAVYDAVASLGAAHPRDLDAVFGTKTVTNAWGGRSKETKRILEDLHHRGFLRVHRREKGVRVYAAPAEEWVEEEAPASRFKQVVLATARVFGPVQKRFLFSELRHQFHLAPQAKKREALLDGLLKDGLLSAVDVEGVTYYWIREQWPDGEVDDTVRILAPFDPLIRDRERFQALWGWDYRFEAYVPAAKRVRGYYAMPLLWKENVIGWANARNGGDVLTLEIGYVQGKPRSRPFEVALEAEAERMARFLGLESGRWRIES